MLKKILKAVIFLGIIAIIGFIAIHFSKSEKEMLCSGVHVTVLDTSHGKYIDEKDINKLLVKNKLNPEGILLKDVSIAKIEQELRKNPLVDDVTCYKTPSGKIGIDIQQRIPLLKIYGIKSEQYYIDNKGKRMPKGTKSTQPTLVASGNISEELAKKEIYQFAQWLQKETFWNNQIEQVYVVTPKDIELIPRVGNHVIYIGDFKQYEEKLDRLKIFYDKVISQVGWNKYSKINIEFENQIICTKAK